ncbi:MFS transporter [Catelliglobosispora koreensis]|uniref:MFS transporter n=1 Tax=Catelliglobosispora koreensis TaxID=129052 RepID=UPI000361F969|nr:MFS transporter [Catelliglobosispora koreensis]
MLVEIITGLGVAMGISVGALLTKDMAGTALSGVAQSAAVVGGALMAVPASALMQRKGRRPGLAVCYLVGSVGGVAVLCSALWNSLPLLFLGFFLFGSGNTGKLQARYAAIDLATPEKRGRDLGLVVWSTTLGAVIGPLLAAPIGQTLPGVPQLAAPFAFASLSFLIGGAAVVLFLRPDPLMLSKELSPSTPKESLGLKVAWRAVLASPAARLGISSMSIGHLVMVAVMAMTPLHIGETHTPADTLKIVGIVISAHIAGMYGLSPVVGWLTDKLGRRPVILSGIAILITACAIAGTAGDRTGQLTFALVLLGLGWSGTMVAGSTLFSESIAVELKAPAQGLADLATGMTGASAGLVSGVVVGYSGYPVLTLLAALATLPLIALALRPLPEPAVAKS